jgi:hypothetical protein
LIIVGGTSNHIHLLVSLGKNEIAQFMADLKRSTSLWMKKKGVQKFYWQKGYGAFSIGQSQVAHVARYIRDQKEHHSKQIYQDEFRALCGKYEVEIDERFVWERCSSPAAMNDRSDRYLGFRSAQPQALISVAFSEKKSTRLQVWG